MLDALGGWCSPCAQHAQRGLAHGPDHRSLWTHARTFYQLHIKASTASVCRVWCPCQDGAQGHPPPHADDDRGLAQRLQLPRQHGPEPAHALEAPSGEWNLEWYIQPTAIARWTTPAPAVNYGPTPCAGHYLSPLLDGRGDGDQRGGRAHGPHHGAVRRPAEDSCGEGCSSQKGRRGGGFRRCVCLMGGPSSFYPWSMAVGVPHSAKWTQRFSQHPRTDWLSSRVCICFHASAPLPTLAHLVPCSTPPLLPLIAVCTS